MKKSQSSHHKKQSEQSESRRNIKRLLFTHGTDETSIRQQTTKSNISFRLILYLYILLF